MAVLGALGDIVFSVSRNRINTIDGVKWETGVRFAQHDRHLKIPLLEFTGNSMDTISFSLLLHTKTINGIYPKKGRT